MPYRGTMGDETSSNVSVSSAPKTKREQNLEGELRRETDPARKRAMKEELDELRKERPFGRDFNLPHGLMLLCVAHGNGVLPPPPPPPSGRRKNTAA